MDEILQVTTSKGLGFRAWDSCSDLFTHDDICYCNRSDDSINFCARYSSKPYLF